LFLAKPRYWHFDAGIDGKKFGGKYDRFFYGKGED
jgi:hypothetical protein